MENNEKPEVVGAESGRSLKEIASGALDSVKGPVFWLAVGFFACKFMDRRKKTVV